MTRSTRRHAAFQVPARFLSILLCAVLLCLCGCSARTDSTSDSMSGGTQQSDSTTPDGTDSAASTDSTASTDALYLPEGTNLEVLGFNAGKADAFLLTTASHTVLIDAGEKGFGRTILAELEERGVTRLDYMIITHFDQDHVGGAARILNNFDVGTVLQSNSPKDSEEYGKYVKALNNASIEAVTVREALSFTLDGVSFYVDPPRKNNYQSDDSNNSSLIVTVRSGDTGLAFLGDAQTERLEEFLAWNTETWDVLKVPHHGKEEPLLPDVIASVQPRYAVITSSDEEPEDVSTLDALDGVETYLTRQGDVLITCTEDGLEIGYR